MENKSLQNQKTYRFTDVIISNINEIPSLEDALFLKETVFNSENLVVKESDFTDEETPEIYSWEYNQEGKPLSFSHFQGEEKIEETFFTYNEKGQVIQQRIVFSGGGESIKTFSYNESGNLLDEIIKDEEGVVEAKMLNRYDEQNRLVKTEKYNDEGILTEQYQWTYFKDNSDLVKDEFMELPLEKVKRKTSYTEDGLMVYIYNSDGKLHSKQTNTKDAEGRNTAIVLETKNGLYEYRYMFNESGLLLKEERFLNGALLFVSENEYDQNGNYILRKITDREQGFFTDYYINTY